MENWTEIKTAYLLGKLRTVSATAEVIGVHRATVIRRVESLELQLGGKLFQRHTKGYTPTEFGHQLIKVAEESDRSFRQLVMKAQSQDNSFAGEFTITCPELLDYFIFPAVKRFKSKHPQISMKYRPSKEVLKLEYGDANVAITFGNPPDHPDYVVRPLTDMSIGLYCVDAHEYAGNVEKPDRQEPHDCPFILSEEEIFGDSVKDWIKAHVRPQQVVMTCSTIRSAQDAILSGLGAGFLPKFVGTHPANKVATLVPPSPDWSVPVWLVTHVDLHRSAKVQSFLAIIKDTRNSMFSYSH